MANKPFFEPGKPFSLDFELILPVNKTLLAMEKPLSVTKEPLSIMEKPFLPDNQCPFASNQGLFPPDHGTFDDRSIPKRLETGRFCLDSSDQIAHTDF